MGGAVASFGFQMAGRRRRSLDSPNRGSWLVALTCNLHRTCCYMQEPEPQTVFAAFAYLDVVLVRALGGIQSPGGGGTEILR
jgi:hypothetical protein